MKNPDNQPLRIRYLGVPTQDYCNMLSQLAIAEATLVAAGKDSALPHFIAVVKELERLYSFEFVIHED